MIREKKRPATLAGVNRASEIVLANVSDFSPAPLALQASFLARRIGMLDPATLSTLAALAFPEAQR